METEGNPDNEAGETKNKEKKSNGNAGLLYEEETILSTLMLDYILEHACAC